VQSALHLVVQVAVVGTSVHCVVQWSLQHALHEAWQSVEDVAVEPSGPDDDEPEEVQDALQPDSQRELQSVVQSNCGGLWEHIDEQLDWQLDVHVASAEALHWLLHCCSSFAAHACSQVSGAHCVEQLLCETRLQCAPASTSMSPQAKMFAMAILGAPSRPAKAITGSTQWLG
jgi:hypothetical protein